MIKVLLNSPCNLYSSVEILTNPIGLTSIKAYCESRDPDVDIRIVPFIDRELLERERPHIVGLSTYAATFGLACRIAELCRGLGIRVVVGGEQITTLPHLLTPHMDVAVLGEGEHAFDELLRAWDGGWSAEDLRGIAGLAFRDGDGGLLRTGPREPIRDLDALPIPDILLGNEKAETLCVMSSRGCPYRCTFCATGWHRAVRWFSPARVVETIAWHKAKYPGLRRVKFWDDLFTVKKKRVEEIVRLLEERGLTRSLNYTVATRTDHIDDGLLDLLERMNCIHVSMGMESGCDETLSSIRKGTTAAVNRRAAELLSRRGFFSEASFIIGFPRETKEQVLETYRFIRSLPLNKFQIFLPVPYPGTELWAYAKGRNLVSEEGMDWEALDLIATMYRPRQVLERFIVLSETMSREELYRLLKRFGRLARWKTFRYALLLLFRRPEIVFARARREARFWWVRLWRRSRKA